MRARPVVNMFWIGRRIGRLERLSMVSFLATGHPVRLHCYEPVEDLPQGVEPVDAAASVPRETALALLGGRRGSATLASDYFRIELQAQGKGLWADCDMVCIRPLGLPASGPLFGRQDAEIVNNALLYLEKDSPIASDMIAAFAPGTIPSWLDLNRKWQLFARRSLLGQAIGPTDHHRGTFGPRGLTELAKKHGQFRLARPEPVFYPYDHTRALEVFRPGTDIADFITEQTLCVHLWNEMLADVRDARPAADSAIGRLLAIHGL